MKRMMLLTVMVMLVFPLANFSKELNNFNDIFTALKAGKNVKAIFYYKQCQLISDNKVVEKVPDAIGGMMINSFEYFAPMSVRNKEGYISTSKTVLINHPSYGFVMNYAKIRIYENNKIRIIAQYVDPKTYEIKMDESFYTVIKNKKNKGAASFFLVD